MKIRFALAAAAVLVLTLSGCNPGPRPAENFDGVPTDGIAMQSPEDDSGLQAFWLEEGEQLGIAIWGSSTCPVIGTDVTVLKNADEGNSVRIELATPSNGPCTMDYVPHTTVFWTPVFVTTTKPLKIEVGDKTVTLPIK